MSTDTTATVNSPVMPDAEVDALRTKVIADALALGMPQADAEIYAAAKVRAAKAEYRRNAKSGDDGQRENMTYTFLSAAAASLLRATEAFDVNDDVYDYLTDLADMFQVITTLDSVNMAANLRVKSGDIGQLPKVRRNRRNANGTTPTPPATESKK